ncbi:MAG: hypothetical protein IJU91_04075 [Selenomonadaceae bacterium]|nr:hypothetical protein [Selenomonadaceae bacterium]
MLKRTFAAVMTFVAMFCFTVAGEAAASNNWLIYWYICGSNLESGGNLATKDIAEMQHVKLPPNVKILIYASGLPPVQTDENAPPEEQPYHHPAIQAGGDGIYLYSSSRLEKVADFNENMGDPATLAEFLKFGEENFKADRRIMYFWNHGGLGGVCYDDRFTPTDSTANFYGNDGLSYDELTQAFASVYGNSPENKPFELIGFKACMTGSYELANSISNFSHYMLGAEPSIYDTPTRDWINALAKNPSMTGAQIGKVICDSAMKNYSDDKELTHIFSVTDLDKMPQLRKAYEAYFDEAVNRSDEEGFLGAFARAAEARNVDKYSDLYIDLGLLAKNTKSIMPKTSADLITAIDNAVVYSKRGEYLKSKGISTYYPFISMEGSNPEQAINSTNAGFKLIGGQNSSYQSQKVLYSKLLNMKDMSALQGNNSVPIELNEDNHFVATLTPEQMGNISSVYSLLIPVKENYTSELGFDLGGAILTSTDNFKVDWNKGTVTENFRAVEPMFDGHRIILQPLVSGRGNTLYKVPIVYNNVFRRDLIVSYDTSKNTYSIIGFGSMVENGVVRAFGGKPEPGEIITPLYLVLSDDPSPEFVGVEGAEYAASVIGEFTNPQTGQTVYWKWTQGTPFVYTKDATITNRAITKGNYVYLIAFGSPGGYSANSLPGAISISNGKIFKYSTRALMWMAQMSENEQ